MNTQNKVNANFENLTEGQIKQLALMQHLGEDYFFCPDGIAYVGNLEETKEAFNNEIGSMENEASEDDNFSIYCSNNLSEIEDFDNDDYLVLTDEEADEKAKEYILDTVWAFNASFLASETDIDIEVFEAIQNNGRCESNNRAILSMIDDEDDFVASAISADGRGHFMSSYDGNENEENVNGTIYYIYRIN